MTQCGFQPACNEMICQSNKVHELCISLNKNSFCKRVHELKKNEEKKSTITQHHLLNGTVRKLMAVFPVMMQSLVQLLLRGYHFQNKPKNHFRLAADFSLILNSSTFADA